MNDNCFFCLSLLPEVSDGSTLKYRANALLLPNRQKNTYFLTARGAEINDLSLMTV